MMPVLIFSFSLLAAAGVLLLMRWFSGGRLWGHFLGAGLALPFLALGFLTGLAAFSERFRVNAPIMHQIFGWGGGIEDEARLLSRLTAPAGWRLEIFASDLPSVRLLLPAKDGVLASLPRSGQIVFLGENTRKTILEGLDRPHGLEWVEEGQNLWLYVAEGAQVQRFLYDAEKNSVALPGEVIISGLPEGGNHWTRTLKLAADGYLYLSIGSSCNVCEEAARANLIYFRPDGSRREVFATGLRNTVGWDWHPQSGKIYGVDNGRDLLGDDFPPCELNLIERGGFYGWPYYNGDNVPDPDLGANAPEGLRPIAPVHNFPAHSAPLALRFIRHGGAGLQAGDALVSLHGSWNRTRKSGYEIVRLRFSAAGIEQAPFLTGFELDEHVIGRPVDIVERADGALFISDDYAGAIYLLRPDAAF